jgi:hypothetical protein
MISIDIHISFLGISQLTLDEEAEDYESVSDQTSTNHRSGDSLLTTSRQNTVTTFGFVDKNNAPVQSPSHSLLTDAHHSGKIKYNLKEFISHALFLLYLVMLMKNSHCRHLSCMDPTTICSNNNDETTSSSPVEV